MKDFNLIAATRQARELIDAHEQSDNESLRSRRRDAAMAFYLARPEFEVRTEMDGFMRRDFNAFMSSCRLYRERMVEGFGLVGCCGPTRRQEIHNSLFLLAEVEPAQRNVCVPPLFQQVFDPAGVYFNKRSAYKGVLTMPGAAMLDYLDRTYNGSYVARARENGRSARSVAEQHIFSLKVARTAAPSRG